MPFLDRQKELAALERAWASGRAEMVILYGRRRVGKSELLSKFLLDKPHVYYVGTRKVERDLLAELTEQAYRLTREELLLYQPFQSWDAALSYLAGQASNQRLVLALDEFSYTGPSSLGIRFPITECSSVIAVPLPLSSEGDKTPPLTHKLPGATSLEQSCPSRPDSSAPCGRTPPCRAYSSACRDCLSLLVSP